MSNNILLKLDQEDIDYIFGMVQCAPISIETTKIIVNFRQYVSNFNYMHLFYIDRPGNLADDVRTFPDNIINMGTQYRILLTRNQYDMLCRIFSCRIHGVMSNNLAHALKYQVFPLPNQPKFLLINNTRYNEKINPCLAIERL